MLLFEESFHDLDLYRYWMNLGIDWGVWPVLDSGWVYPAGAIVPMLLPGLVNNTDGHLFALAWCGLITVLNALAVLVMLRRGRSTTGVWWWLAFMVLLGPVAMGRLDSVVVPMMIVALAVAVSRPRVASVLLTAAAWIKVAPAGLLIPVLLAARRRWRDVVLPAALVSLLIVSEVIVGGGFANLASFLSEQGTRGLQIESVGATPWVVAGLFTTDIERYLNGELITWEISGPGSTIAVNILGVALPIALALAGLTLWWVRRRVGAHLRPEPLVVRGALIIVLVLIVFNKVGSPQFLAWLAAPVAIALAMRLPGWTRTAQAVLLLALLTQFIFPLTYGELLGGHVLVSLVLVVRNLLLVALLVQSVWALVREEDPRAPDEPTVPAAATDASTDTTPSASTSASTASKYARTPPSSVAVSEND